ncbi:hypothetical protein H072_4068 [Dactylellina haptotyla CBS 200.50]|uniref:Uncharacterized protein n=1 Tax=Dactylellina haptotyla (strain CBS 200.50) TaxID=1284197 RepID=S8ALL9_DACHA|nr:hypothetical protein H072_4068 [Dactylellina haptotyla CBS 200.50]
MRQDGQIIEIDAIDIVSIRYESLYEYAGCQANNCIRAVTGTAVKTPSVASRKLDCNSAQLATAFGLTTTLTYYTTITPATVTVTASTTITVASGTFTITASAPVKRDEVLDRRTLAAGVPSYASACTNLVQYKSACSCLGVTATTLTVAGFTASTTATMTATLTQTDTATLTQVIPATTITGCPVGYSQCLDGCKNLKTDANNCGVCGVQCSTCANRYCSNPGCVSPGGCNTGTTCSGLSDGCSCAMGVGTEGNFCVDHFYGSCFASPECTTSADCPPDGRCVAAAGVCCGVNICGVVGTPGGYCDYHPAATLRFLRRSAGALVNKKRVVRVVYPLQEGDRWPQ